MWRIVCCVVLVGVVAACGGDAQGGFPTGTWTNTCERGTVKVIDFEDDGSLTATFDNAELGLHVSLQGTYSANETTLTFESDSECGDGPGVYAWAELDDELAFTLVEDGCAGRVATMDGYVFTPVAAG